MRIIKVKNCQDTSDVYGGVVVAAGAYYEIEDELELAVFQRDKRLYAHMAETPAKALINNGASDLSWLDGKTWLEGNEVENLDRRHIVHSTPRFLGTYTYFTGTDDNQADPHAVGGGANSIMMQHAAATVSLATVERASNVATAGTSSAHGLVVGAKVDIAANDNSYNKISALVLSVPTGTTFTYANTGDDEQQKAATGTVSGNKLHTIYMDFNTIYNKSYIRQGDLMWSGAKHDMANFCIVPKITPYSAGSNTYYNLYGGYLIIPAAGDGVISVSSQDMILVQNTPNEFGNLPAGYWDATWNTSNKCFENITPNIYGTGEYNMFGAEVVLFRFMHQRRLLGDGRKDCMTEDVSQLGHNLRMRVDLETYGSDHDWEFCATLMMYRAKTV